MRQQKKNEPWHEISKKMWYVQPAKARNLIFLTTHPIPGMQHFCLHRRSETTYIVTRRVREWIVVS